MSKIKRDVKIGTKSKIAAISMVIAIILGFLINAGSSWTTIPTGQAILIVDVTSGQISEPIVGPSSGFYLSGLHRFLGLQYAIYYEFTMTDANTLGMWGDGTDKYADYPAVACFSRDQLEMYIDVYVRWELEISSLRKLYINYPTHNYKNVIASVIREQMRIVTGTKFTAVETIEQRNVVAQEMKTAIISKLLETTSLSDSIINIEFELRNIGYPAEYTKSIEAKLAAQQQMMQAEYEKQKTIILAEADAEKILIAANAQANATIIRATSQAEAIKLLAAETNTPETELVKLFLWLDTLKTLEKPVFIMFLGADGIPMLLQIPQ